MEENRTQPKKENRMGTEPIGKLIVKMSLPMMLSMLMLALYNVVDSIFVSRVSENALTAVSLAFPFQMLIVAVAVGTGIGVSSLIARKLGEKDQAAADLAATNGQFLALVSALVFTLVYALFSKPLLGLFTDDMEILDYAASYLSICGGFCIFSMFQTMNEKTLQATGNMIVPMLIQLVGAVANMILDPIMIFGLLGFPKLGVAGAAIATVTGQALGMIFSLFFIFRREALVRIDLKRFRPDKKTIGEIYVVGLPSIVMQSIGSLCNFGMNKILITFTPTAVSVLGVYFKLQSFVFMPVFGLNSGAMPIMGYNYGARCRPRLMRTLKLSTLYAFSIMVLGLIAFQLFAPQLLTLFDASENMMEIGTGALRTISLCFPVAGLCIIAGTLFSAIGKGVYSLWIALCRQLLVILPVAYLLARVSGLSAVWYAYPIAEFVSLTMSALLLLRAYRKYIKPLDAPAAQ